MWQSPSPRGSHFYGSVQQVQSWGRLCQSPSRRGTHFYWIDLQSKSKYKEVSIPFTSRNSFLLITPRLKRDAPHCVNPLHLGELISTVGKVANIAAILCVNPLHTGELISTIETNNFTAEYDCVNPLHTGELISTLYLIFVDFMRVSSLDFRGIFQTILKTTVFSVT